MNLQNDWGIKSFVLETFGRICPNGLTTKFINPEVVTKTMSLVDNNKTWILNGRQRAAVARVLRKPMTGAEICAAARRFAPKIQLRDVWFLMLKFQRRGLAICLNPNQVTGRLYCLTDTGHAAVFDAFTVTPPGIATDVDWKKYSFVIRAKVRRLVLNALSLLENHTQLPQTATMIRKRLRDEHGVGLRQVIQAIHDLAKIGLVCQDGVTEERRCKLYRLTPAGIRILTQIRG